MDPHQVVSQLVRGGQAAQDPAADVVQVAVHQVGELGPVGFGHLVQILDVEPQVVLEGLALVRPEQAGRGVRGDELVDVGQRGHPVAQVGDAGPALRDGQPAVRALAPVVDDVGDHVHGPGQHVGLGHQPDVFPDHALRVGQLVLIPEAAPEQLVPDRHVVQQPRRPGDVRAGLPALEGQRMQRRRIDPRRAQAVYRAADEVGSRLLERVQEQFVRVGRQQVIAVDEGQELAAGALDAAVARASGAAVLRLEQREPRVGRGLVPGDLGAVVGGAVVDHDHFQVGERLGGDRVQAVGEVAGVVEERHDDADLRALHWLVPPYWSGATPWTPRSRGDYPSPRPPGPPDQPSATGSYTRST